MDAIILHIESQVTTFIFLTILLLILGILYAFYYNPTKELHFFCDGAMGSFISYCLHQFSEEKNSDSKESFPVHEFSYNDFKRLFKVPKIVEADKINAKYVNGVLQVSLPKLKEAILRSKKIIKIS